MNIKKNFLRRNYIDRDKNSLLKNVAQREKWKFTIDKTYILNRKKDIQRKQKLISEFNTINFANKTKFFKSLNWWESIENVNNYDKNTFEPFYEADYHYKIAPCRKYKKYTEKTPPEIIECSKQEKSIALSHISILEDIISSNVETVLVLEDDIYFRYDFEKRMNNVFKFQIPSEFDMIYLSSSPIPCGFSWEFYSSDLIKVNRGVFWFSGFIITKKGARKLLEKLPVKGPIDVWINHHMEDLDVFMTKYNFIEQDKSFVSNNKFSFFKKYGYMNDYEILECGDVPTKVI